MFLYLLSAVLVVCATAAPQTGFGGAYNRNQYRPAVQAIQPRPQYNLQPQPQVYNAQPKAFVPITSYTNDISPDGSFQYSYTSADGTAAQSQGYLKNAGQKDLEAQVMQGSYSYTSPDGTPITVNYIADENGFRAEGAHLPTPPPIPEAIAKSLQYIAQVAPQQQQQQQYNNNNQYNRRY